MRFREESERDKEKQKKSIVSAMRITGKIFRLITCIATLCAFWPATIAEDQFPIAVKHFTIDKLRITEKAVLNEKAYRAAIRYFNANRQRIKNKRYLTIIDYSKPSFKKRMYLIDMRTGEVRKYFVAHGKNSGYIVATSFSNQLGSLKSCKGFFLTGGEYVGKHGTTLVLNGMEKGINDNARERGIVMHGSRYVSTRPASSGGMVGRSWGCPAVPLEEADRIIDKIKNGSLLYIHADT